MICMCVYSSISGCKLLDTKMDVIYVACAVPWLPGVKEQTWLFAALPRCPSGRGSPAPCRGRFSCDHPRAGDTQGWASPLRPPCRSNGPHVAGELHEQAAVFWSWVPPGQGRVRVPLLRAMLEGLCHRHPRAGRCLVAAPAPDFTYKITVLKQKNKQTKPLTKTTSLAVSKYFAACFCPDARHSYCIAQELNFVQNFLLSIS